MLEMLCKEAGFLVPTKVKEKLARMNEVSSHYRYSHTIAGSPRHGRGQVFDAVLGYSLGL